MSEQYDEIADLYHETSKANPFRQRQAGFTSIRVGAPGVSEEGLATYGSEHWQPSLDRPHAMSLEAIRS